MQATLLTLFSVIGISMLMGGCGPDATVVYGRASNPDRVKRGLPVIPTHWIERGGGPQADWFNPACPDPAKTHGPMHSHKELLLDKSGKPLQETDYYQSGKSFLPLWKDPDDPSKEKYEELYIRYDFEAARAGKNPWYCEVNAGPHARE